MDGAKYIWVWFGLGWVGLVGLVWFVECSILSEEEYCHNPNSTPTSTKPSTSVGFDLIIGLHHRISCGCATHSNNSNKIMNNTNYSLILKMGWLAKFISLRLIPFLLGGACAAPKLWWASLQDLWLWNFDNHPIFTIEILRRENFFSPKCRSKVVKFTKKNSLDAQDHSGKRWAIFIFPLKMIQWGDHWIIFSHFLTGRTPKILPPFYLFWLGFFILIKLWS